MLTEKKAHTNKSILNDEIEKILKNIIFILKCLPPKIDDNFKSLEELKESKEKVIEFFESDFNGKLKEKLQIDKNTIDEKKVESYITSNGQDLYNLFTIGKDGGCYIGDFQNVRNKLIENLNLLLNDELKPASGGGKRKRSKKSNKKQNKRNSKKSRRSVKKVVNSKKNNNNNNNNNNSKLNKSKSKKSKKSKKNNRK